MTEKYDETERQMGILAYAASLEQNPGFAAVVKARYSDFLVHEVGTDGNIARLTSLENNLPTAPKEESNKRDGAEAEVSQEQDIKKAKIDAENASIESKVEDVTSTLKDVHLKLAPLVGDEAAEKVISMLQHWENLKSNEDSIPAKGTQDESKYYTFPFIDDKQKRKDIHQLIKSDSVKPFALADTEEKKVRIWHRIFESHMPNYGKFVKDPEFQRRKEARKKKMEWPKDTPDYLQFVLYKENIDTGTAAKDISRILRLPQKANKWGRNKGPKLPGTGGLGYGGMKDKRGCTTQFCTLYRKTPEDLMILNKERTNDRKQGGGNSKSGGNAIMRVGHFSYVNRELRLGQLSGNRFDIVLRNVCIDSLTGTPKEQRITQITSTLKKAATSMKNTGFINYFGMQRFGKFYDTHLVGTAILKGDFEEACNIIMRPKEGENEKSISTRKKWECRFEGVDMNDENTVEKAERECANTVRKELGRFMNCETSIVSSLSRNPRDYKKAFGSIAKHMRSMFLHAYQSYLWNKAASYRISDGGSRYVRVGDLVLVADASEEHGGNGTSGLKGKEVHSVTQDDIEACKFSMTDVVIPLVGSKIDYPTDSTGDMIDELLEKDGLTKEDFEKIGDRELAVGGDYRKVICKPADIDFEIKVYTDPLQPLVKTDLMNVHNAALDCVDMTDESAATFENDEAKAIVGMKIGFTLPPSSYATIALRELTRRPTSSQYQSELKLEGDCEEKIHQSQGTNNKE